MKKQLDVRVKDNFLSDRDFWFLKDLFFNEQTIYYPTWKIADLSEVSHPDNFDDWFLTHPIYDDHYFYYKGTNVPSIDIIDFDYPHWHTIDDTVENCSPKGLKIVGSVLLEYI